MFQSKSFVIFLITLLPYGSQSKEMRAKTIVNGKSYYQCQATHSKLEIARDLAMRECYKNIVLFNSYHSISIENEAISTKHSHNYVSHVLQESLELKIKLLDRIDSYRYKDGCYTYKIKLLPKVIKPSNGIAPQKKKYKYFIISS